MSGVFRNIDPHPLTAWLVCVPPARLWCGGRTHSLGEEGVGGNSLEDARHCSALCTCKYSVVCVLTLLFDSVRSPIPAHHVGFAFFPVCALSRYLSPLIGKTYYCTYEAALFIDEVCLVFFFYILFAFFGKRLHNHWTT